MDFLNSSSFLDEGNKVEPIPIDSLPNSETDSLFFPRQRVIHHYNGLTNLTDVHFFLPFVTTNIPLIDFEFTLGQFQTKKKKTSGPIEFLTRYATAFRSQSFVVLTWGIIRN